MSLFVARFAVPAERAVQRYDACRVAVPTQGIVVERVRSEESKKVFHESIA